MRQLFLLMSLFLFICQAHAQNELQPIIALSEGSIYAINPSDGRAEIIVPASDAYGEVYEPASFFSAEWLSPDGQYLAYRMTYPLNPNEPITETSNHTQRLFMLDLVNGTFPRSINLGTIPSYEILSVAWSPDGNLFYVLIQTNAETENVSLFIIERDNWAKQIHISPEIPEDAIKRTIFATEEGVVLQARGWMTTIHAFIIFDNEGEEINRFELASDYATFMDMFISTPFTPLLVDGVGYYSIVDNESSEIRYQIDFASGDVSEFPAGYLAAMVSRANPNNSLRVSLVNFTGVGTELYFRDAALNYLGGSNPIRFHAFGPDGDSMGMTFALSPDGQALAYLEDHALLLWQDGESRSLDFSADVIVWASPLYIPIHDPEYFQD